MPRFSLRSRLLNALEVVSGKLVEDGEMAAAASVLTAEATRFLNAVAGPPTEWRSRIVALVADRAAVYAQTAPAAIINQGIPAFRASIQAARNYLSNAGDDLPAADRTMLEGLANEAAVQADILQASAENTSPAFTQGLLSQFRDLAERFLSEVRFGGRTLRDTLSNSDWRMTPEYTLWLGRVDQLITMLRQTAVASTPHTLYGVYESLRLSTTEFAVDRETITFAAALQRLTTELPQLRQLFNAYLRISFGFTTGNDAEFTGGKADIITALNAAGLRNLASSYLRDFIGSANTRNALETAYSLQERQQRLEWWDEAPNRVLAAAQDFATGIARDLPLILISSALSGGTVGAAAAMWRVATGVRLATRVVWATNFAVAIPIGRAVDRAIGRPVDDSFLGTMKQAGLMLGTQIGFSIVGSVGRQAFTALRRSLAGAVQQAPSGLDLFVPRRPSTVSPPSTSSSTTPPTGSSTPSSVVTGLRNRNAFQGMNVIGQTASGSPRISAAWRRRYGPSATRRHHLIPQELLRNPEFIRQMQALGYTRTEIRRFVDRQIADLPNVQHMQIHAEGWNEVWRVWLQRNPRFSVSDIRSQINSMISEFEIPAAAIGGPIYGR